ncbi:hypothetical protein [Staphylococcus gallinarum]|uniref:hypothetical protein n=1 Tax=Staphylococcus gallinarum TaxID=1293 RepID=UPI000D1C4E52|nr:hypothetical protein [Staphylococcus gallinarum]PTE73176.1 hypothetical protein BUY96_13245 [Staphylococcus gallinarum]
MKKVLFLILASFLVLTACGSKEENKSEDKKETKSSSKDNKKAKEDKKEKSVKKEDTKTDVTQQEKQQNVEQPQPTQEQTQPVEQPVQQEPTEQEKMEANAKVAKQHGFTGIPNGETGVLDENMPADEQAQRAEALDEYARQNGGDDMDPYEH